MWQDPCHTFILHYELCILNFTGPLPLIGSGVGKSTGGGFDTYHVIFHQNFGGFPCLPLEGKVAEQRSDG